MSRNELIAKIEALNEWERLIAEAQAEAEAIKDSIKAEMLEQQTEERERRSLHHSLDFSPHKPL